MPSVAQHLVGCRSFSDTELAKLQHVYERACRELTLEQDSSEREKIARIVFAASREESDPDNIFSRTAEIYRKSR